MRSISIPLLDRDRAYAFCPLTGSLLVEERHEPRALALPGKVQRALKMCDDPFLLAPPRGMRSAPEVALSEPNTDIASTLAKRMHDLRQRSFLLASLYARFRKALFDDCAEAIAFFNGAVPKSVLPEACLQKSLFALKTARNFPAEGVLFVGVFLPTTSMHAWVIEENRHADPTDSGWIMYRPVFAYY